MECINSDDDDYNDKIKLKIDTSNNNNNKNNNDVKIGKKQRKNKEIINNDFSSSISNNSFNHPGSESGREENSNIINIVSAPEDDNKNNDVKEVTSSNINKKDKNALRPMNVKSSQQSQSVMSHVPAVLSKLPATKNRHHACSNNANRRLDSLWDEL